jgi:hypothetical protein
MFLRCFFLVVMTLSIYETANGDNVSGGDNGGGGYEPENTSLYVNTFQCVLSLFVHCTFTPFNTWVNSPTRPFTFTVAYSKNL